MENAVAPIIVVAIAILLGLMLGRVSAATVRLERKLDLLLRNSNVDVSKAAEDEAAALARAGKKIEAIRLYRELTGCGLAEAKAKVESLS